MMRKVFPPIILGLGWLIRLFIISGKTKTDYRKFKKTVNLLPFSFVRVEMLTIRLLLKKLFTRTMVQYKILVLRTKTFRP